MFVLRFSAFLFRLFYFSFFVTVIRFQEGRDGSGRELVFRRLWGAQAVLVGGGGLGGGA